MNALKVLLVLFFPFACTALEYIESFHSDITIHHDGSMTVVETIDIVSELRQFKHGLLREFPTHYKDAIGNTYRVFFTLHSATMNNDTAVPAHSENWKNGKRIYIGYPDRFLHPGPHRFSLTYKTNRQLGYFKEHDELYWNVTGNGWNMPIKQASATIHLPEAIKPHDIKEAAFTGFYNERSSDYKASIEESTANFITTKPLAAHQGLTIVVGWPKGFIQEPSFWTKINWFFADNRLVLAMILFMLGIISYLYWAIRKIRSKKPAAMPIIPRFYPPEDISPALIRNIIRKKTDSKALACQIVHYAIQGLLSIDFKKDTWKGTYSLIKKQEPVDDGVFSALFDSKDSVMLSRAHPNMQKAFRILSSIIGRKSDNYYYFETELYTTVFVLSIIPIILGAFLNNFAIIFMGIALIILILFLQSKFYQFTPRGINILHEIEGFKLFLTTAEIQRFETIGTPPTKTPELWEKYLPYAMALDVEKQWSNQFASVFKNLERQEGHPYQPHWFMGFYSYPGWHTAFYHDLSAFNSTISSSAYIPGSRSGLGGDGGSSDSGSSGGGGGGGGGGGW